MSIVALNRIAFNKESSWGNPGATWQLIPVNPPTFTTTFENILDQGLRGVAVKDFGAFQGAGASEASLEGIFHPEHVGYMISAIMGSPTSSGTATPYIHTFDFNSNAIVPSLAFEDYPAIGSPGVAPLGSAYQYTGLLCNNLTIKFNAGEGAVSWTASFMGKQGTVAPKVTVTTAGTAAPPFLGWEGSVLVDTITYQKLSDYEITFAREVAVEHAARASQQPAFGYVGPLEVTLKATVDFSHEEDFARYRNNSQGTVKVMFTKGAKYMFIDCPKTSFLEAPVELDRGGVSVKAAWSMRALYDVDVANTPCRITLANGTPNY
mgnify:FL=1